VTGQSPASPSPLPPEGWLRLHALFENALDAILLADDEGHYVDANPAACALTGYSRAELLRLAAWDLAPTPVADAARRLWMDFVASGRQEGEYRLLRKDGSERDVEYRAVARITPGLHLSILRDITERTRAERALSELRRDLASVTGEDFLQALVLRLSQALGVAHAFVGERLESPAGRMRTLALCSDGRVVRNVVYELTETPCQQVLRGGEGCYPTAVRKQFPNDQMLVEMDVDSYCGTPLVASDGAQLGVLVVMGRGPLPDPRRALTLLRIFALRGSAEIERLQGLRALRAEERRYRSLFDGIPLPAYRWRIRGDDLVLAGSNAAASEITGGMAGRIAGSTASVLYAEDPLILEDFGRCVRGRTTVRREMEYRFRATGDVRTMNVAYAFIHPDTVMVLTDDVTEARRAQRELRRLSARLLRVQDDERRRLARSLHDGLGQQLAGLAMKLASLARPGRRDEASSRALAEAQAAAEGTAREVRTLSYLLHPPLLEEVGLLAAVRWLAEGFAERSGVRVSLNLPPLWDRLAPEAELGLFRVVQEALANVHLHSGSPSATVSLVRDQEQVELEVSDAGCGIPGDELDARIARGVGVAGMRERLRELGGRLELQSADPGTRLRAVLPLGTRTA